MNQRYLVAQDIQVIRELCGISQEDFAKELEVSRSTIERWENDEVEVSESNIEKLYSYAYHKKIYMNKIKEQLYKEDYIKENHLVLFHGAKSMFEGALDLGKSKTNNDFGKGFYCGETFKQASMFVSSYSKSSIYILDFDRTNLKGYRFAVDQEWMLTIAYFRGRLEQYKDTLQIKEIRKKVEHADYIVAPIADNRMFQIIDSFIEGEITDEQCRHCLSATNLGFQYVFKTQKALKQVSILERCYLCQYEKEMYRRRRSEDNKVSEDKVKIARKQYRGQGHYIDEILV